MTTTFRVFGFLILLAGIPMAAQNRPEKNPYGQIGDGSMSQHLAPLLLSGPASIGLTAAIAAGVDHGLALKSDRTVWTWGRNSFGELGDGTTTDRLTPFQVSGITGVVAISGGGYHSLALRGDGTVWAWGYGVSGQLGNGSGTGNQMTPIQVSGLTGVVAISGGFEHSMALKSDGTVWTWGRGDAGQLGDGSTANRYTPVAVSGLTGVVDIAAGGTFTMALKSNGTVWAWGDNLYGQLGDGSAANQRPVPVQVGGLTGAVKIAAGYWHSLALKSDGTVSAWGYNYYGQLGDGNWFYQNGGPTFNYRTAAGPVSGLAGVTAIAGGGFHSLALKGDGTVWAWGRDDFGQVGDGIADVRRLLPVQTSGFTGGAAIAGGYYFSVALKGDGTVWTWGYNHFGALGDGSTTDRLTPVATGAGCSYQISNAYLTSPAAGSSNIVTVTAPVGCAWTAASNAPWLQFTPAGGGSGTANVTVTAPVNTGPSRASFATIAGFKVGVTQAGTGSNTPPSADNIAPFTGVAISQTFTISYSDPNGAPDIATAALLINAGLGAGGGCYLEYISSSGQFRLLNDTGLLWLGPGAPGAAITLQNSQCSVNLAGASAAASGNTLAIAAPIAFASTFTGRKALFVSATDNSGATSDWTILGNWWPGPGAGSIVNRYRIFNKSSNTHIHTTDLNEYATLIASPAVFNDEKVGSRIYDTPATVSGVVAVPYHRIYITAGRSHFWTSDRNEYLTLIKFRASYNGEGVDGFILPSQTGNAIALRRLNFCPGGSSCPAIPIHHWTIDQNEFSVLTAAGGGWLSEGIAGYVYSPTGAAPSADPTDPVTETNWTAPAIKAVVHGAHLNPSGVAAGQRVRIWGQRFGTDAEVRFDGVKAQVVSVTESEIEAVAPAETSGRAKRRVTVSAGGVDSAAYEVDVAEAAPGILASDEFGRGLLRGYAGVKAGDVVTVRFTGRGPSDAPVAVTIGGVPAELVEVTEAWAAPGYFEARVRVPANVHTLDGLARVSLSIGAAFSQTGVLLRVME